MKQSVVDNFNTSKISTCDFYVTCEGVYEGPFDTEQDAVNCALAWFKEGATDVDEFVILRAIKKIRISMNPEITVIE